MLISRSSRVLLLFLSVLAISLMISLIVGCSDDDEDTITNNNNDTPVITYDIYVDIATGNDITNDGSESSPYKSITKALSVAVAGDSIKVAPGKYDGAVDNFPITIPDSVFLFGDTANRGVGTDTIRVEGSGGYDGTQSAVFVGGDGAMLTGFLIVQPNNPLHNYCIISEDDDFTMVNNTFNSGYACVRLLGSGDPVIRKNTFTSPYYGLYSNNTGSALIRDNDFGPDTYIQIYSGSPSIIKNTFTGSPNRAIDIVNSTGIIDSNTFTGGYIMGCLMIQGSSTPTVRNNTLTVNSGSCVQILHTADPDLGTSLDPGNNVFGGTSVLSLYLESTADVDAIGNTWPNDPPICDSNIIIHSGAGKLAFGTGVSDTCEAP